MYMANISVFFKQQVLVMRGFWNSYKTPVHQYISFVLVICYIIAIGL